MSTRHPGKYVISKSRFGRQGFSISRDGMNPMPGATHGFGSFEDALLAIRCLEHVGGERNAQRWWDLYHRVTGVTSRERSFQRRCAASMGMRVTRTGKHSYRWEKAS